VFAHLGVRDQGSGARKRMTTKIWQTRQVEEDKMDKKMYQSKTVWTGIVGLATAAGAYFAGGMNLATAIQTAITCLVGIFLRHGMLNKA